MKSKKFLIAGLMAGIMVVGAIPTFAASTDTNQTVQQQQAGQKNHKGHRHLKNGEKPPEPSKDENGNPLPPPDCKNNQGGHHDGHTPPEPPKDENGNPLPPPDGKHHGQSSDN